MKQIILSLFLLALPLFAGAQETQPATPALRFGYFSYQQALQSMPEYPKVQSDMAHLKSQYQQELKRVEDEFNKKYEAFLDGQKDFAPTILRKRQAELQELMEKNISFKEEARRLLKQAEGEAYAPLHKKLSEVVRGIGDARGYAFILNTDDHAVPYVNGAMGEDITSLIYESVK